MGDAAVLEAILEHAAASLPEFAPSLFEQYYRRFPAARASFADHAMGNVARLETAMADAALYCFMHWLERPQEVRLIMADQMQHHRDTLDIEPAWFIGLLEETVALLRAAMPGDFPACRALCDHIGEGLTEAVRAAARAGRPVRRG